MTDDEKISILLDKIKEKDEEDYQHLLRVQEIVEKILTLYDNISDEEKKIISTAALIHDVGILEIPDNILKKSGRLDFDEYEEIKQHTTKFDDLIKDLECYEKIKDIIRHHHENVNGFGYPDAIEGDEIPLGSKIIHVVEAYDSMVHARKNRQHVFNKDMATQELKEYKGRIYDSEVVDKFIKILPEVSI